MSEAKDSTWIYNDLWRNSLPEFKKNHCAVDRLIRDATDQRRGITLLARLSPEISVEIEEFLMDLTRVVPDQYVYPASDFHLTVLSIISCHDGFKHDPANNAEYMHLIDKCLESIPPLEITFSGITASPACLMIQGFPKNDSLQMIREQLRRGFKASALHHTIDSRYPITTAHTTVMRFQKHQTDLSGFVRFIEANKQRAFGTMKINTLELVGNDWYQRRANTRPIGTFTL